MFGRTRLALLTVCLLAAVSGLADTLVMKDGTTHTGRFLSATSRVITFREGKRIHHYPVRSVQQIEFGGLSTAATKGTASPNERREGVTIPSGTEVAIRTNEDIDSKMATVGQKFSGMVAEDVTGGSGMVEIPKGSNAELVIRNVSSGNITGGSELAVDLASVEVHGHRYAISSAAVEQKGSSGIGANRRTAEMVGGGAALGTLIGAIAGHGKGAAIGAVAGAAAGAGTQVLTKGKQVHIPAETVLRYKLDQPLHLQPMP
jgi:hypothetical protein